MENSLYIRRAGFKLARQLRELMKKPVSLLGAVLLLGLLASGCAGPEKKLGRGLSNMYEIVRWGDMRRTIEQTTLFESKDATYATGMVRGFNRSMARFGIGLYETITFPIPSYDPIATSYLTPHVVYPDNYKPRMLADSLFATDTTIGFSGGDVAPNVPGSRFRIFDN
jgi:putative exosortase-associated protein (TIGR04073 family)